MKLVTLNPFRIAGILANTSEKEIRSWKNKVSRFASVGKVVESDYDFPKLGTFQRDKATLDQAFSNLQRNEERIFNGLFWFLNGNSFDETALNYMKAGDLEKAIEIWEKVTLGKDVNSKNYSSFNNISTLRLLSSNTNEIKLGIGMKFKLISSSSFKDFVLEVADETYSLPKSSLQKKMTEKLVGEFKHQRSTKSLMIIFDEAPSDIRKEVSKKLSGQLIENINAKISSNQEKRRLRPSNGCTYGTELYIAVKSDLAEVQTALGINDFEFKDLSDRIAEELLKSSLDHFKFWKEKADPSKDCIRLLEIAKKVALDFQLKGRINENIEGMSEWAKTALVKGDLDYLTNKIKSFDRLSSSISNALELAAVCKDRLKAVRTHLGRTDETYLILSSAVVNRSLSMIIDVVNSAQTGIQYDRAKLLLLPGVVSKAVSAVNKLSDFDMDSDVRSRYRENKKSIEDMDRQLQTIKSNSGKTVGTFPTNEGCYIATMVYGDYDNPQVLELRRFRDESLKNTLLGRCFIRVYYKYSPSLVKRLENKTWVNNNIRKLLDQFVNVIKEQ